MDKHSTVELGHDEIVMGPVTVSFQRTLRIPEEGLHPLPPGLGRFPLRRVEDYPHTAPSDWLARGGIMLPIYQREAMWLSFDSQEPAALQVGTGQVCAVSGETWSERLTQEPQNYLTLPDQLWLDGINAGDGFIRQFVAVPLSSGLTIEKQVTGEAVHGGVQLLAVGLTPEALQAWRAHASEEVLLCSDAPIEAMGGLVSSPDMGLGAGGRMRQEVYTDDRRMSDYAVDRTWRVFVHLCTAAQWTSITGEVAPPSPIDRDTYVAAGLPWFAYYDADAQDLPASEVLRGVKGVGELTEEGQPPFVAVDPGKVITLNGTRGVPVTEGDW